MTSSDGKEQNRKMPNSDNMIVNQDEPTEKKRFVNRMNCCPEVIPGRRQNDRFQSMYVKQIQFFVWNIIAAHDIYLFFYR